MSNNKKLLDAAIYGGTTGALASMGTVFGLGTPVVATAAGVFPIAYPMWMNYNEGGVLRDVLDGLESGKIKFTKDLKEKLAWYLDHENELIQRTGDSNAPKRLRKLFYNPKRSNTERIYSRP